MLKMKKKILLILICFFKLICKGIYCKMGVCFKVIVKCMLYEKYDKDVSKENEVISFCIKGKGYFF